MSAGTAKEVEVTFNVTGGFRQTIEILTTDTPRQFIQKLNDGEYLTTMGDSRDVVEIVEGKIEKVGKIVSCDSNDSEYSDFEKAD